MPSFSFERKVVSRSKGSATKSKPRQQLIEVNCEGIVAVNKFGDYVIRYKEKEYTIAPECFETKGKKVIYCRKVDKYQHRIKIIRDVGFRTHWNLKHYAPFAPGLVVKGKIVLDIHKGAIFHIISVYNLGSVQEVKDANKEWQEYLINKREIEENGSL